MTNFKKYLKIKLLILLLCGQLYQVVNGQQQEISIAQEYWSSGQKEKAYQTYRQLLKDESNLELIHAQYLTALLELHRYKEATDHCNKMIRRFPEKILYKLDNIYIYVVSAETSKADRALDNLFTDALDDISKLKDISEYWISHQQFEYAAQAINTARKITRSNDLYTLELANIYRLQGRQEEMIDEYLRFVSLSNQLTYLKDLLQQLLTKSEEKDQLKSALLRRVQEEPNNANFADLLLWIQIQQKDFFGAFIQAKAYDKRFGKGYPVKTMDLATIAINNNDYETAIRCYQHVIKDYPRSEVYLTARIGLIKSQEQIIHERRFLNLDSLKLIADDYHKFYNDNQEQQLGIEARINEARLKGLQLKKPDSAISILNNLLLNQRLGLTMRSKIKIDLADYYLLNNEPWESALLYAQVEKTQKDSPLAYEAKLKSARLSYYRGDFRLAEEHLDILKQATSREIANDALELSLRIKENIRTDSIGNALKIYAAAELLLLQDRQEESLKLLSLLEHETKVVAVAAGEYPSLVRHDLLEFKILNSDSIRIIVVGDLNTQDLLDDVYWLKSKIFLRAGRFQEATEILSKIIQDFSDDVLADDAAFKIAEVYEINLRQTNRAMELYQNFLQKFPSSVYAAEARKRFRTLRGDYIQ